MNTFGGDDIDSVIVEGITFKAGNDNNPRGRDNAEKVRTKAKKKQYITGSHCSASAKKKADIRKKRANRHNG